MGFREATGPGSSHPLMHPERCRGTGEHRPKPGKGILGGTGETNKMVGAAVFCELF